MFFGMNREERRQQVSAKAREERLRRSLRQRWDGVAPVVSTTGVEFRLSPVEKRFALIADGTLTELDGACLLDARTVSFDRPALATVDGVRIGAVASAPVGDTDDAGEVVREPAAVLVRVNIDMRGFEVLDFPIWSRGSARATDDDLHRAFASADELVRRCLSVR